MAEYIQNGQNNYGWNLTWKMSGKYPVVADRIYETLAAAQAYVDDISSNACIGVILTVNNDGENNGAYRVASYASAAGEKGVLEKLGSDISLSMAKVVPTDENPLPTNVKEAYQLVDDKGNAYGVQIPIYKDSSLKEVAVKESEGKQYLSFTYITSDGSENVVDLDVSQFLVEAEFDQTKGLAVNNGVVSVKLSADTDAESYLTFGDDGGLKIVGLTEILENQALYLANLNTTVNGIREDLGTKEDTASADETASAFARIKNLEALIKDVTGGVESIEGQINDAIGLLDSEVTSENGEMLNVKVTQTDGKITSVEIVGEKAVELTGSYNANSQTLQLDGFTISDVQA